MTVKVWDVQYFPKQSGSAGALGKAMLQIDQAFMKKYPNIKVDHVGVPGSQFITQMRTFVASRKGPDVVTDGGGSFPVNSGFAKAMRPMYDLITPQQKKELGRVPGGRGHRRRGPLRDPRPGPRLPLLLQQGDVLEGRDLAPPQTFQDLLSDCSALKKVGITPITNGWSGSGGNIPWNYGDREPGAEPVRRCRPGPA